MKFALINVVHALPHRIRLHFNEPPHEPRALIQKMVKAEGIIQCSYSTISHNLLVTFDPTKIGTYHVLRMIVLGMADQYCMKDVIIRVPEVFRFTGLSFFSLSMILLSYGTKSTWSLYPSYLAAISTSLAVFEHAALEVDRTGVFDPEAFSVLYLFSTLKSGVPLKGASWTWFVTFGRHFIPGFPANQIRFSVIEGVDEFSGKKYRDTIKYGSLTVLNNMQLHPLPNRLELLQGLVKRYREKTLFARSQTSQQSWALLLK